MTTVEGRRGSRRHGHVQGHIRDTFLAAIDAYIEAEPGSPAPRIPFQVKYRDRRISIAEACRLVWTCTDIMPIQEFEYLVGHLDTTPGSRTYAAAARTLLREIRDNHVVDDGADAKLKRMYDERDRDIDRLASMIAAERSGDENERARHALAEADAQMLMDKWLGRDMAPTTRIEVVAKKIIEQFKLIDALEAARAA
jgi:hypothetical protein